MSLHLLRSLLSPNRISQFSVYEFAVICVLPVWFAFELLSVGSCVWVLIPSWESVESVESLGGGTPLQEVATRLLKGPVYQFGLFLGLLVCGDVSSLYHLPPLLCSRGFLHHRGLRHSEAGAKRNCSSLKVSVSVRYCGYSN